MVALENPTDVTAIQAVTDNLPNDGALTAISDETDKIDNAITSGLTGTVNSLAYRVGEIERHLHSGARWFGAAVVPNGEIHVADRLGVGVISFVMDAGNNNWGNWLQVLGSSDTPAEPGKAYFDPHQFIVEDTERASTYFIQITRGTSGDAGLAAGAYSEFVYSASVQKEVGIIPVQTGRAPVGSKLWARCLCPGQNTGTISFFIGIHEYEG